MWDKSNIVEDVHGANSREGSLRRPLGRSICKIVLGNGYGSSNLQGTPTASAAASCAFMARVDCIPNSIQCQHAVDHDSDTSGRHGSLEVTHILIGLEAALGSAYSYELQHCVSN